MALGTKANGSNEKYNGKVEDRLTTFETWLSSFQ